MLSFLKVRGRNLWERLRTSFWLIPSIMSLSAFLVFGVLTVVDRQGELTSALLFNLFEPVSASGARVILSTIAGSTITIVGTVFSITIVTLTLASSQFGPRLLKNFISSRGTQFVLGILIATFIFSLCVLTTVEPQSNPEFIPRLAVDVAVLMALANVVVLIYFIHHVAVSIQADSVIRDVTESLLDQIRSTLPEKNAPQAGSSGDTTIREKDWKTSATFQLKSRDWGYVQALEHGTLLRLAGQHNLVIRILEKPGSCLCLGQLIAEVEALEEPDPAIMKKITGAFVIGPQRSPEQDLEFAIHQLVEVAVRALSPGINDPYTAMACIDHLGVAFSEIVDRHCPEGRLADEKGYLRVVLPTFSFAGAVAAGFNQIRQHASGHAAVLIRLLEVLKIILATTESRPQRDVLLKHAEIVWDTARASLTQESDLDDVQRRWNAIRSED